MQNEINNPTSTTGEEQARINAARSLIEAQQVAYANARGRKALARMVADAHVCISTIIATVDDETQALILSQYQAKPASGNTSKYSPYIATMWGENDPDPAKKKLALDGKEYRVWHPNLSMAVYFHTMEELAAAGFDGNSDPAVVAEHIISKGGAQKMANERKARIAKKAKPGREKTEQEQRELYLEVGPQCDIALNPEEIRLPADAGTYVSLVVERCADGSFKVRGVAEKNALGKLNRLAKDAYDGLVRAKADQEERARILEEGRRQGREEERQNTLASGTVRMTPEMLANAQARLHAKSNEA